MIRTDLPLVVISCGGKKRQTPCRAADLYIGPYFKACLAYARRQTSRDRVVILSAKYGLLALNDMVAPYDLRISQTGAVSAAVVRQQAESRGLLAEKVVAVCGQDYLAVIRQVWSSVTAPLEGVGGLGHQLAWLKRHTPQGA